ncbi:MAG: hypothetical protein AB7L91_14575 [Dehalococcoidia bacterium]
MAGWRLWSGEPEVQPTITDDEWRELQERARRANPALADSLGAEATARRLAAAENFKHRRMN